MRSFHLGYWIPVCTGLTKASLTNTVITAQAGIQKSLVNQILRDTNIVWSNRQSSTSYSLHLSQICLVRLIVETNKSNSIYGIILFKKIRHFPNCDLGCQVNPKPVDPRADGWKSDALISNIHGNVREFR